ncbi:putative DNA modification/repair radical SAM protein [Halanaerobacter jeridensis]|uniref:DNA modification/repair radical SAM protein n=1 Tax=Halanaerobacter jeridensis TaxID=706427 RepID=A0A938XQS8_9FIRM|nr:putative DNA modification/repair radical SAM protein [Halanaerobacter jeridensis]MBM7555633.1 putative DNA modification/repair radical SAM protein [Halanaerobacter jeridensis]
MDLKTKLSILSDAAKYDASCSSSGSSRSNKSGGVGNAARNGICHSWSEDGRCISLLKILFTNNCIYDCAYCINRASNDKQRASFTPEEVIKLTINFYRRNYIEGLFLSSAVEKNPDYTMEQMLEVVKKLREEHKFNGYIHLKAIPGADSQLIQEAGTYADRMSVNIELPSNDGLQKLAPGKKKEDILKPMNMIGSKIVESKANRKKYNNAPQFVPAGQSPQLIVGATPEPDYQILRLSESLYQKMNLKRVYYSAYVPVNQDSNLPAIPKPPLLREHRLYQADWLLRFYGFSADELLNEGNPELDLDFDPKMDWALRNLDIFPIEINKAGYDTLLRIPGIGVRSAKKIISARQEKALNYQDLKKIGPALNRAKYFITCRGKYYGDFAFNPDSLRQKLKHKVGKQDKYTQLSLF